MPRVLFFDRISSTNTVMAQVARAGGQGDTALAARIQTAGRGQGSREWASPPGGLWMSTLLRREMPAARAGWLPLAAGVALVEVFEELGVEGRLKWPNDVLVDGHKVAGILAESSVRDDRLAWAVIGTGINVANEPPLATATSLSLHGVRTGPRDLAGPVASSVASWVGRLADDGFESVRDAWMEYEATLGRRVRTPDGVGDAVGVGDGGELVVETADGAVLVRGGPLEFVGL